MKTLVYKRTHDCHEADGDGDPCAVGCFGCWDCMGRVRGFDFEAVIGIGGVGKEARGNGITGLVNWIGIGPQPVRTKRPSKYRGPLLTFDQFRDFRIERLPVHVYDVAPALAEWMYTTHRRYALNFPGDVQKQIDQLLRRATGYAPSSCRGQSPQLRIGCGSRH
jgi:hypothetical protein